MVFTKRLREAIRRGRITCSVRIWTGPHVKVGGCYGMDEGQIVIDSITPMKIVDITDDLARESGFSGVKDLLQTAKHGRGSKVYLIRFHYLRPGAWDVPRGRGVASKEGDEGLSPPSRQSASVRRSTLLQRIRSSTPGPGGKAKGGRTTRSRRREA